MSRRLSPFLPAIICIAVVALIAVPLWFFFDWRERSWREACQAQGGQPVRYAFEDTLICVDGDGQVVAVRR